MREVNRNILLAWVEKMTGGVCEGRGEGEQLTKEGGKGSCETRCQLPSPISNYGPRISIGSGIVER